MEHPRASLWLLLSLAAILLNPGSAQAEAQIPPPPGDFSFVADYAGLLQEKDILRIGRVQLDAFKKHDVPIIVVTIHSMAPYGGRPIERLAYEWFAEWRIGTLDREGGANKGMLLLISTGDRRARIELGADWGRRWDRQAKSIMDGVITPRFRSGDFAGGIVEGVRAMGELATRDPFTEPSRPILERLSDDAPVSPMSPIPGGIGGLMILAGIVLCALSFFFPTHRKWLLILGIGLIVAALLLWLVLAFIGLLLRGRGRGGFGSRGGFSGGFSGGGGATGSW